MPSWRDALVLAAPLLFAVTALPGILLVTGRFEDGALLVFLYLVLAGAASTAIGVLARRTEGSPGEAAIAVAFGGVVAIVAVGFAATTFDGLDGWGGLVAVPIAGMMALATVPAALWARSLAKPPSVPAPPNP